MIKLLFVGCALCFAWLLWQGLRCGEILGQGWWGRACYYSRLEQPFRYWATVVSYATALLVCFWGLRLVTHS